MEGSHTTKSTASILYKWQFQNSQLVIMNLLMFSNRHCRALHNRVCKQSLRHIFTFFTETLSTRRWCLPSTTTTDSLPPIKPVSNSTSRIFFISKFKPFLRNWVFDGGILLFQIWSSTNPLFWQNPFFRTDSPAKGLSLRILLFG